jgi:hypothetical protein
VSATAWKRVQLGCTILWAVLIIPSVIWWRNSLAWVVAMSAYALVASHAAGWMAARGDENSADKSDLEPIRAALRTLLANQAVLLDRVAPVEVDQPEP